MANQITGRIIEIGQTVQIPSKSGGSPFTKREFILDATTYDPYTGERSEYENIIPLEFSGDKCAELDRYKNDDVVTVSFALQGRSWTNQDGELKRMASIRCYKIEGRGVYPSPHKLHQYNNHSQLIINRRIFRLRLMQMVMQRTTYLFSV